MVMSIQKFQRAPNLTLYDTEKNKISLNEQRDRNILILFFPLAFPEDYKELCMTRNNLGIYNNAEAKNFGISVDSIYVLKRFKEELQLNFDRLNDFNREASTAYDG